MRRFLATVALLPLCGCQTVHTLEPNGVPVAMWVSARDTLLTDKRLVGSGVEVLLIIPAGTGRRTSRGFEVPILAPSEPVRLPTTTEAPEPATAPTTAPTTSPNE